MNEPFHKVKRIEVPPNWTVEKDRKAFVDCYGESSNYFKDQMDRAFDTCDELADILEQVSTFLEPTVRLLPTDSLLDRILRLERHVLANAPSNEYQERLLGDLAYCRFGVTEFARIIPDYELRGENGWLWPLIALADHLASGAIYLEESMQCEHEEFPAPWKVKAS